MPFKKGQGGRPAGARNRVGKEARDLFTKLGGTDGKAYAEQLHQLAAGKHDDPHARLKALAIIAPYLWGKPVERLEHSGVDGGALEIRWKS